MEGRKEWGENPAERKPCGYTNAALGFKAPRVAPASSPHKHTQVKGSTAVHFLPI